jgi:hypothetical protein
VSAKPAAALDRDREVMLLWFRPRVPADALEATPAPDKGKKP